MKSYKEGMLVIHLHADLILNVKISIANQPANACQIILENHQTVVLSVLVIQIVLETRLASDPSVWILVEDRVVRSLYVLLWTVCRSALVRLAIQEILLERVSYSVRKKVKFGLSEVNFWDVAYPKFFYC